MKVILSVPDEGYFERTWWWLFWAYLMMVILSVPDDGYFERTWWWLFQKTSCTLHLIYLPHEQHNRRLYNLNVMSRRFGIIFPFRGDCVGEYLIWSIDYFVYAFHALYIVYLIIWNLLVRSETQFNKIPHFLNNSKIKYQNRRKSQNIYL